MNPNQLSKKVNKTPQAVYKKINTLLNQSNNELQNHIEKDDNDRWVIDEVGAKIIIDSFVENEIEQPDKSRNEVQQQFNNELNFLKEQFRKANEQNEFLNQELCREREYSRKQSEEIIQLTYRLTKITENNQELLRNEQAKSVLALPPPKRKFFQRFFKKNEESEQE